MTPIRPLNRSLLRWLKELDQRKTMRTRPIIWVQMFRPPFITPHSRMGAKLIRFLGGMPVK